MSRQKRTNSTFIFLVFLKHFLDLFLELGTANTTVLIFLSGKKPIAQIKWGEKPIHIPVENNSHGLYSRVT